MTDEEIIKDDIEVLREEYESLWRKAMEAFEEMRLRIKAARKQGIEV